MAKISTLISVLGLFGVIISCQGPINTSTPTTQPNTPTYTVTYMDNGATAGSPPTDSNDYLTGDTATVMGKATLVKTGSTFAGWTTKSDGSGLAYSPQSPLLINGASVILYARWTTDPTYTVTYLDNGATAGSPPTDTNAYLSGATATVMGKATLVKTGSTFAGWTTKSDGSGLAYSPQSPLLINGASVILYARWTTDPTYTVTYLDNGATAGSPPTDTNAYLSGATATVIGNTSGLSKSYYSFNGWNTKADGTGLTYIAGNSLTIGTAPVILYARWTKTTNTGVTIEEFSQYTVDITGPNSVAFGQTVTLNSTYSGTALSYQWYIDGTPVASPWGTGGSFTYSPSVATATYGAHLVTLLVTDANGLIYSTSQTITVHN